MPDPLAGVREKLNRADCHLKTLHEEIGAFIDAKRDSIVDDFEHERSSYVFWLQDLEEPPLRWGVIIGEIVHNLRSALDHLVWQVIKLKRKPRGKPGYPIWCKEPEGGFCAWAYGSSNHRGPLFGASPRAIACIERTQPYHGGDCRLLLLLDRLWSADKHRFMLPRYVTINPLETLMAEYIGNHDAGPNVSIQLGSGAITERGAELVVIGLNPRGLNPKVEMKGDQPFEVTFDGDRGIVESLEEIVAFVRTSVLGTLQELFPQQRPIR